MAQSCNRSGVSPLPVAAENEEQHVSKLFVLHVMKIHFRNIMNYQTYRPVNKSQQYNGKLATHKGKYVKRMESMMMPCMFDDCDPITILRSLDQFKSFCDFNKF